MDPTPPPLPLPARSAGVIVVGIICILIFGFNLINLVSSLFVTFGLALGEMLPEATTATYIAYGLCWGLSLLFSVALLVCGVLLVATRREVSRWFYGVVFGQLSLLVIVPTVMTLAGSGESATVLGAALLMPLFFQCLTLFPIWGSVIVYRERRSE